VQYVLVVVTPVQVFLLALTFADDDVTKPLTIVPTGISCSTDGVGVVHVVRGSPLVCVVPWEGWAEGGGRGWGVGREGDWVGVGEGGRRGVARYLHR
jgi:hypothetical protein